MVSDKEFKKQKKVLMHILFFSLYRGLPRPRKHRGLFLYSRWGQAKFCSN